MFHFTHRRIEAHICICFIAYKVYKELERIMKLMNFPLSVDKALEIAKTIPTVTFLHRSDSCFSQPRFEFRHLYFADYDALFCLDFEVD